MGSSMSLESGTDPALRSRHTKNNVTDSMASTMPAQFSRDARSPRKSQPSETVPTSLRASGADVVAGPMRPIKNSCEALRPIVIGKISTLSAKRSRHRDTMPHNGVRSSPTTSVPARLSRDFDG